MKTKDLHAILKWGNQPIRVGIVGEKLMLSLSDLRMALGLPCANVTNITKNLPWETNYRVSTVDLDGKAYNNTCIAVTRIGAYMALAKTKNVDQSSVLHLMEWIEKLDETKLKGA